MKADPEHREEIEEIAHPVQLEEDEKTVSTSQKEESSTKDLAAFLTSFQEAGSVEEKIRIAIAFMESRLSLAGAPGFKDFWEARKLCLPLFRETISPWARSEYWQQYTDLSTEARRLKSILEEQSVFAFEQIELAIQALLRDLTVKEEILAQVPDIEILVQSKTLASGKEEYNKIQKELFFLNGLAAKVNALRKEVIRTDMRVRSKNKLFEKLSSCGDQIFPRRKELILVISERFASDIERIMVSQFSGSTIPSQPLHQLREEVKTLQSIAKVLTLNTQVFTETRLKLSRCWDLLREWDKERKKEVQEKREQFHAKLGLALEKVVSFEALCAQSSEYSSIEKASKDLFHELKDMGLDRFAWKDLQERIDKAKAPHEEQRRKEVEAIQIKERAEEESRAAKVFTLRSNIESFLEREDLL